MSEPPSASVAPEDSPKGRLGAFITRLGVRLTLGELAIGAVIGLLTWPVATEPPKTGIDPSWVVGLHLAARHGLAFGHDILFTFGPLGFLGYPQPYLASTSGLALGFVAAVHVAGCIGMFHLARQALGGVAAFLLVSATAFALTWVAGWTLYGVLIFGASATAVLRGRDRPTGALFATALGIAVGACALGKLSIAPVSLLVAVIAVLATARDVRRSAMFFGGSGLAAFAVLWIATGQRLEGLPVYVRGTLEFLAGYGQSMGQLDPQADWTSGVNLAATLILGGLLWLRSATVPMRDRLVLGLLFAIMVFSAYKGGFTRQGIGMVVYLVTLLSLWPILIPRRAHPVAMAMPIVGMLAMVLAMTALPVFTLIDPARRLEAFTEQIGTALIERREEMQANAKALRSRYALPQEAVALLAGRTVDIQPWDAAAAYAYPEMDWRPQPVFQAYAAYTPYLDRLNASLLETERAPERILWWTDVGSALSIDGRNVWFDSPAAKVEMICRYAQLAMGVNWQVLGRADDRCGVPVEVGMLTSEAGEPMAIPRELPRGIVTARISGMGRDLWSQITAIAFRAPPWWMTMDGVPHRIPLGINGEATIIGATTDIGYSGPLTLPQPPESMTIGPDEGEPGNGSPLTVVFEVIPITAEP